LERVGQLGAIDVHDVIRGERLPDRGDGVGGELLGVALR
jgi:hypothetical protein